MPITLATDAFNYGLRAYLYQTTNEQIEQPLAFISEELEGTQLNWSTPEKECNAIFYSMKKFEYFIQGIHFTLHTHHINLSYINEVGSPQVVRWKIVLQEFIFDIKYLQGEKNTAVDHWSRTLDRPYNTESREEKDDTTTYIINLIGDNFMILDEIYKCISAVHNSIVGQMGVSQTLDRIVSDGTLTEIACAAVYPTMSVLSKVEPITIPHFNTSIYYRILYRGCEHVKTVPYSSEENGLVERAKREVVWHLRTIFFDKNIVEDLEWLYP